MPIELVIFDCDGVLVDSEPITSATWVDALTEIGLSWTAEEVDRRFRGGKLADIIASAEAAIGRPVPGDFVPRFRTRLYERLRTEVRPVPGVPAVLDALPYAACVASNGPREKMEATLGSTGLLERFEDRIFTAYEVESFKPEPGLFLHAARACGASPQRCVVVEDSDTGVRAARRAGMLVVAYDESGKAAFASDGPRITRMHDLIDALTAIEADSRR